VTTIEEISAKLKVAPFVDKLKFVRGVHQFTHGDYRGVMQWEGRLSEDDSKCVWLDDGDCYVYVWKHNFGDPFYVGSGKKDRWTTINNRCEGFYEHIDKADAIVYKVIDGIDRNTAFAYEKYVSFNLSAAGYDLANHDNNYQRAAKKNQRSIDKMFYSLEGKETTLAVEKAVFDILNDEKSHLCRTTMLFLDKYGEHFFSEKYGEHEPILKSE
jgi:hypothetical protein